MRFTVTQDGTDVVTVTPRAMRLAREIMTLHIEVGDRVITELEDGLDVIWAMFIERMSK